MTKIQRVKSFLGGLVTVLFGVILYWVPFMGVDLISLVVTVSLLVLGIKNLYFYAAMSRHMVEGKYSLFSGIREHDVILCADTSTPKNGEKAWQLKYLSCLDHFFCNEAEAKALCDTEDLFECERIFYDAGVGDVIIKLGEKGCLNKGKIIAPERKIWCIDSTGAGDSFVAGYLHGLSLNLPVEERLHMANEFGGKACEHVGANKLIEAL